MTGMPPPNPVKRASPRYAISNPFSRSRAASPISLLGFPSRAADVGRVLHLAGGQAGIESSGEIKAWPRKSFRLIPGVTVPERNFAEGLSDHVPEYSDECEYSYLIESAFVPGARRTIESLAGPQPSRRNRFFGLGSLNTRIMSTYSSGTEPAVSFQKPLRLGVQPTGRAADI
jgi:hypothetical protein